MLKKFVSLTTALAFLSSFIVAPSVQAAVEYAEGTRYAAQARSALDSSLPAFGIDISPANGRVTDVRDFGAGPLVINIQDLHCHPEVQRNIAALLGQIEQSYDAGRGTQGRTVHVFVEGGYGTVDTSWISALKDPALRTSLIAVLVDGGHLTGAELYAMQANRPTMLTGLEDEALHKGNIVRLGKILENKPRFEQSLATLRRELAGMQAHHFTTQNKRLSRIIARYRAGDLSSAAYYALLGKYIEKIGASPRQYNNTFSISHDQYPNIALLRSMATLSKGMNFRLVSTQMQKFMQSLRGVMSFADYNALVDQTQNFKDMDRLYLSLAAALAGPENAAPWVVGARREIARYRELQAFFSYVLLKQQLNPVQLVREERLLVEQLRSAFSRTTPELEVAFLTDFFDCYSGYLLNRLSADDYRYFASRFEKFQSVWGKYTFENRIKGLADDYPLLNEYYAVNARRNAVFLRAIDAFLAPGGNRVAVIVSGGFHTEGLTTLLAGRKISSATITPGVTQDTHNAESSYVRRALDQSRMFGTQALQLVLGSFGAKVQNVTDQTIELVIGNRPLTIQRDGNVVKPLSSEAAQVLQDAGAPASAEALNAALQGTVTSLSALSAPTLLSVAGMVMALGQAVIESGSELGWWGEEGLIWKIASDTIIQQKLAAGEYDLNQIAAFPAFLQTAIAIKVQGYDTLIASARENPFIAATLSLPSIKEQILPLLAEEQEAVSYADRLATLRSLPLFTRLANIIGFSFLKGLSRGYETVSVIRHDRLVGEIARTLAANMGHDADKAEFIGLSHDLAAIPYRHLALAGPFMQRIMSGVQGTNQNYFKQQVVAALQQNGISVPSGLENDLLNFDIAKTDTLSNEAKIAIAAESVEGVVEDILFSLMFGLRGKSDIPKVMQEYFDPANIPDNLNILTYESFDGLVRVLTAQALASAKTPSELVSRARDIKRTSREKMLSAIHAEINTLVIPEIDGRMRSAYAAFKAQNPTASDEEFIRELLTLSETSLPTAWAGNRKLDTPQDIENALKKCLVSQELINKVLGELERGELSLHPAGEKFDVVERNADGKVAVLASLDRNIIHRLGLLHSVANGFIVTVAGNIVVNRRRMDKSESGKLSAFGGHVLAGESVEDAFEREIREELGLPAGQPLQGKIIKIAAGYKFPANALLDDEQVLALTAGINPPDNEILYFHAYQATEYELNHIRNVADALRELRPIMSVEDYDNLLNPKIDVTEPALDKAVRNVLSRRGLSVLQLRSSEAFDITEMPWNTGTLSVYGTAVLRKGQQPTTQNFVFAGGETVRLPNTWPTAPILLRAAGVAERMSAFVDAIVHQKTPSAPYSFLSFGEMGARSPIQKSPTTAKDSKNISTMTGEPGTQSDLMSVLIARVNEILGRGNIPVISSDIGDTLAPYGAVLSDEAIDVVLGCLRAGGHIVFNTRTSKEWYYRRQLGLIVAKLEAGESRLLEQVHCIARNGGEVYVGSKLVYENANQEGDGKADGLKRFVDNFELIHKKKPEIIVYIGNDFDHAGDTDDGGVLSADGTSPLVPLVAVNVGLKENDIQTQTGQIFLKSAFKGTGIQGALRIIQALSEEMRKAIQRLGKNTPSEVVFSRSRGTIFDPFKQENREIIAREGENIFVQVDNPGFVWAGRQEGGVWAADSRHMVPLIQLSNHRYQAQLPPGSNVFTFYFTGDDAELEKGVSGRWIGGDNFTVRTSAAKESAQSVLTARAKMIVSAGDIPVISTDLDETFAHFGAPLTDEAVNVVIQYLRTGGHIVFNSRTKKEWFYRRVLAPLSAQLGDNELQLLNQVHFILRLGGEVYIASPQAGFERIYNISDDDQQEGDGKGAGLDLFLKEFETIYGHGQILANFGDMFKEAGKDGDDGSVLAVAGQTGYPSLVAVNVGAQNGPIITQDGQRLLPSDFPGIPGTLHAIEAVTAELNKLSIQGAPAQTLPAHNKRIIQPSKIKSRHIIAQEGDQIIVDAGGPGFVWAEKKDQAGVTGTKTMVPLRLAANGRYQATLPAGTEVFTFYWTGGKDGTWEAGEWDEGGDFSVERLPASQTQISGPASQSSHPPATMGFTYWAGKHLFGMEPRQTETRLAWWVPWEVVPQIMPGLSLFFGKMHRNRTEVQQKALRAFALDSTLNAAIAAAVALVPAALFSVEVLHLSGGMAWTVIGTIVGAAWYATGAIMHKPWNQFNPDNPATMGGTHILTVPEFTFTERLDQVRALPVFTRLAHVIGFTSMKGLDEAGYDVVSVLGHDRRVAKASRRAAVALNRDPDRTEFIALVHDMGVIPYTHLALAGGHMKGIIAKLGVGADYFKKQSVEALRRGGIDIPEYLENDILNFDINKTDTISDEAKIAVAVESVEGVIEDILFAIRFERFKPDAVPASIRALLGFNELPDLQAISQEAFDAFVIETTITALRLEAGKTPQEIADLAKAIKVKARSELLSPLFEDINAPAIGDIDAKITAAHQAFSKNSPAATDEDFLKTLLGLSETDLTSISLSARPGVKGTPTLKALKARLQEIVAAGDIPIISTDIDDTLTPLGAVLTDDAVDALLAYIRAGGHIVFNSRTKTEWYYRRILEPLSARLGDRELHLLSQIHFIMRLGGEIYVASPRDEQGYIHYERVYNVSQNEGKGKGDGLQLFLSHFNQTVGRGQILGHLGDLFIHAGDGEDGSVLAVAGETKYPSLVAVDVGMHKGNIITQKGQSFLPSDIPGIAGALSVFAALGKELRGLPDKRTAFARTPAQPASIIQPFKTESRHIAIQEGKRIVIEVQGPGFVWAGNKNAANGQWEKTYLIPLRKTRTGTWQAPLPPSANEFTSYWTGGKDGKWEAGEWNQGGNFSVERTKAAPTSAVKPSTLERGKRWGWSDWAIRDILAPVVENFGMLLQPGKFGVQHTQYVPKQQRILTGLAWTTAITAVLAGAGTAFAVALSSGMFLAGAGAGVLAWFATGVIIHAGWNIFSSLPATMGGMSNARQIYEISALGHNATSKNGVVVPGQAATLSQEISAGALDEFLQRGALYLLGVLQREGANPWENVATRVSLGQGDLDEHGNRTPYYTGRDDEGQTRIVIHMKGPGVVRNENPGIGDAREAAAVGTASTFAAADPRKVDRRWGTFSDLKNITNQLKNRLDCVTIVDVASNHVGPDNKWLDAKTENVEHWKATVHIDLTRILTADEMNSLSDQDLFALGAVRPPEGSEREKFDRALAAARKKVSEDSFIKLRTALWDRGMVKYIDPACDWDKDDEKNFGNRYAVYYTKPGDRASRVLIAHGKDPYNPAWPDVLQLDFRNKIARQYVIDLIEFWRKEAGVGGVRMDMAHLLDRAQFYFTWCPHIMDFADMNNPDRPERREQIESQLRDYYNNDQWGREIWEEINETILNNHRDFMLVLEAYKDLDYLSALNPEQIVVYDKRFYDVLDKNDSRERMQALQQYVKDSIKEQRGNTLRFQANHDDPAKPMSMDETLFFAAISAVLPGASLVFEPIIDGRPREAVEVLVPQKPVEAGKESLRKHMKHVGIIASNPLFRHGKVHQLTCTNPNIVVFMVQRGSAKSLITINLSDNPERQWGMIIDEKTGKLPSELLPGKGKALHLKDEFSPLMREKRDRNDAAPDVYVRADDVLREYGLTVGLARHQMHIFELKNQSSAPTQGKLLQSFQYRIYRVLTMLEFNQLAQFSGFINSKVLKAYDYTSLRSHDKRVAEVSRQVSSVMGCDAEKAEFIGLVHDMCVPPFTHVALRRNGYLRSVMDTAHVTENYYKEKGVEALKNNGVDIPEDLKADLLHFNITTDYNLSPEAKIAVAVESVTGVVEDILLAIRLGLITHDDIQGYESLYRDLFHVVREDIGKDPDLSIVPGDLRKYFDEASGLPQNLGGISHYDFDRIVILIARAALSAHTSNVQALFDSAAELKKRAREGLLDEMVFPGIHEPEFYSQIDARIEGAHELFKRIVPQSDDSDEEYGRKFVDHLIGLTEPELLDGLGYEQLMQSGAQKRFVQANLGNIHIVNVPSEGADVEDTAIRVDRKKAFEKVAGLVHRLKDLEMRTCYLWGLIEPSDLSKGVHGFPYREIAAGTIPEAAADLTKYLNSIRREYGIDPSWEIVLAQREWGRVFMTVKTPQSTFSIMVGYNVKTKQYNIQGKKFLQRDNYGNYFSPKGMGQNRGLPFIFPRRLIKYLAQEIHDGGRLVMMDFYGWRSPDSVTEENYMYFKHKIFPPENMGGPTALQIYEKNPNNPGCVLHLSDGRKVLVHARDIANDQLAPDLGLKDISANAGTTDAEKQKRIQMERKKYQFWFDLYWKDLKRRIDLGADAVRWDLMHELQTDLQAKWDQGIATGASQPHDLVFHLMQTAIIYSRKKYNRNFYFMPEVYMDYDRNMCRDMNRSLKRLLNLEEEYYPIKTYYTEPMNALRAKDGVAFEGCLDWLINNEGKYFDAINIANYDDEALRLLIPNDTLRNQIMLLMMLLGKAGFNVLTHIRDIVGDSGEAVPVSGGDSERHLLLEEKALLEHIGTPPDERLAQSPLYTQFREVAANGAVKNVSMKEGKVIFTFENGRVDTFDIRAMGRSLWATDKTVLHEEQFHAVAAPAAPATQNVAAILPKNEKRVARRANKPGATAQGVARYIARIELLPSMLAAFGLGNFVTAHGDNAAGAQRLVDETRLGLRSGAMTGLKVGSVLGVSAAVIGSLAGGLTMIPLMMLVGAGITMVTTLAGAIQRGAAVNLITHIEIDLVVAEKLLDDIRQNGFASLEGGDVHSDVFMVNTPPAGIEKLNAFIIGTTASGKKIWAMATDDGKVVFYSKAPYADVMRAIAERAREIAPAGIATVNDFQEHVRGLLLEALTRRTDLSTEAHNAMKAKIQDAVMGTPVWRTMDTTGTGITYDTASGAVVIARDASADEARAISTADAFALGRGFLKYVGTTSDRFMAAQSVSALLSLAGEQVVVDGVARANQLQQLALDRKIPMEIYALISAEEATPESIETARKSGLAGCVVRQSDTSCKLVVFATASGRAWRDDAVSADMIAVVGQEAGGIENTVRNSKSQCHILDVSSIVMQMDAERDLLAKQALRDLLGPRILAFFSAHSYSERYLQDAVYGMPTDQMTEGVRTAYLARMRAEIKDEVRYNPLEKAFNTAWKERLASEAWIRPEFAASISLRHRQMIGRAVASLPAGAVRLDSQDIPPLNEGNLAVVYQKTRDGVNPDAVSALITMIELFDMQFTGSIRDVIEPQDMQAFIAILSAA